MRVIKKSLLFTILSFFLIGCYDEPDPNVAGTEVGFIIEKHSATGLTAKQYILISTEEELISLWETNALQDPNAPELPAQPIIDFASRDAIAIFPNDQKCNSATKINRVMEDGEKVIIRLRRDVEFSPVYCFIEGPTILLVSIDKNPDYDSRLYEIVYDCIYCDPDKS